MFEKVAVSIRSMDGLSSQIDPRFGRANAFLIVEPKTKKIVAQFPNSSVSETSGAGTSAAQMMKKFNVEAVLSGRFGPKALEALKAFEIKMYLVQEGNTAEQALARLKAGSLRNFDVRVY